MGECSSADLASFAVDLVPKIFPKLFRKYNQTKNGTHIKKNTQMARKTKNMNKMRGLHMNRTCGFEGGVLRFVIEDMCGGHVVRFVVVRGALPRTSSQIPRDPEAQNKRTGTQGSI